MNLEPFGPMAANMNSALISSILWNAHRSKKMKAMSLEDLMLGEFYKPAKRRMSPKSMIKLIKTSFNNLVVRKKKDKKKRNR